MWSELAIAKKAVPCYLNSGGATQQIVFSLRTTVFVIELKYKSDMSPFVEKSGLYGRTPYKIILLKSYES